MRTGQTDRLLSKADSHSNGQNGPELTSAQFVSGAERQGIELRYIQSGKPNQNVSVECFNRSVLQEVMDVWILDSLAQAQQIRERWRVGYNMLRPPESLGKKTPLAYLPRVVNADTWAFNLSA